MPRLHKIISTTAGVVLLTAGAAACSSATPPVGSAAQAFPAAPAKASTQAAPTKASVKHQQWRAKTDYWCMPTSVQLSLRTFGIKASQKTLWTKMKKVDTNGGRPSTLDGAKVELSYIKSKGYKLTTKSVKDPKTLMKRVTYDVGVLKRAVPLSIDGSKTPWIKQKLTHMISIRGYDKAKGTITVWDPAPKHYGFGGHHTVSAKSLAKAGLTLLYVHR